MKLSEQCCSLDQGKRLVELGVKAEAAFWWMPRVAFVDPFEDYIILGHNEYAIAPAYTVGELGIMLPHDIDNRRYLLFEKFNGIYRAWYGESVFHHLHEHKSANEAQSRAALLIYLIENKLIEPCAITA